MKNQEKENPFMLKKLNDALKKLISEEYFAYMLYSMSRLAVCDCGSQVIDGMFGEIAADELNDHMSELVKWCRQYCYDIPCGDAEFTRYADKKISAQLKKLKKSQPAEYYLAEAVKSEQAAIESYRKVLDMDEVSQFQDLQSLLWHIYYDEVEHAEKLNTAVIVHEAGVSLVM